MGISEIGASNFLVGSVVVGFLTFFNVNFSVDSWRRGSVGSITIFLSFFFTFVFFF